MSRVKHPLVLHLDLFVGRCLMLKNDPARPIPPMRGIDKRGPKRFIFGLVAIRRGTLAFHYQL